MKAETKYTEVQKVSMAKPSVEKEDCMDTSVLTSGAESESTSGGTCKFRKRGSGGRGNTDVKHQIMKSKKSVTSNTSGE